MLFVPMFKVPACSSAQRRVRSVPKLYFVNYSTSVFIIFISEYSRLAWPLITASEIQHKFLDNLLKNNRSVGHQGCFPWKGIFHQRSSSIINCILSKVVFHQRSSSVKGRLPSKVVFRQRSTSIKVCLPF